MTQEAIPQSLTRRVRLRAYTDDDAALVRAASRDAYIPLITTVPTQPDDAAVAAYIARQHSRAETGHGHQFVIVDEETDEAVGQIGLVFNQRDAGRGSVGYWISPDHRRRGYVTAALRLMVAFAFDLDRLDRVELYVEPWNEGSWRAAEAAGFQREGLMRAWESVAGERRDMYMYSRLRSER